MRNRPHHGDGQGEGDRRGDERQAFHNPERVKPKKKTKPKALIAGADKKPEQKPEQKPESKVITPPKPAKNPEKIKHTKEEKRAYFNQHYLVCDKCTTKGKPTVYKKIDGKCKCQTQTQQPKSILKPEKKLSTQSTAPKNTKPAVTFHNPPVKQSVSKYPSIPLSHFMNCSAMMFHKDSDNPSKLWGTLVKATIDKRKYWLITEHQLVNGAYVIVDTKKIELNQIKGWEKVDNGGGDKTYFRLPAENLVIPNVTSAPKIGSVKPGSSFVASLYGYNPSNSQFSYGSSTVEEQDGFLIHSVTTANYSCGSFLMDQNGYIVGLHVRTSGPSPQRGKNNFVFCLKLVG